LVEPLGVAFDNLGNLWVTDGSGDKVNIYPPGSTTPSQSITTGYTFPYAISIDPRGAVAVSNINSPALVYAYAPGVFTPFATLTNGITLPTGLLLRKPYRSSRPQIQEKGAPADVGALFRFQRGPRGGCRKGPP